MMATPLGRDFVRKNGPLIDRLKKRIRKALRI
jgi:hypothetical protein